MIELNLQFFGGRGASSGGDSLGDGKDKKVHISKEKDVWSYRHKSGNEPFADAINSAARTMENDFPGLMSDTVEVVNATTFKGSDAVHILGVYSPTNKSVGINTNYTNIEKMNNTYDAGVKAGYHPSRGNKTGTEAVTFHELGHALTDHVGVKMGANGFNDAAKKIVNNAYNNSKGKGGTAAFAAKISGYAKESYAECIAEAVSDWYCNGNKASNSSKAIMKELKKYK